MMSTLSEASEETFDLVLDFDVPQLKWEDFEREKHLLDQGTWSAGSDIHNDWFKEVHPLHESKVTDEQADERTAVDRNGNKLSLANRKNAPSKKVDSCTVVNKATTKKEVVKKADNCLEVEKTMIKKGLAKKISDSCSKVDKKTKKESGKKVESCTDVDKMTIRKGVVKKADSCSGVDKTVKKELTKRVESCLEVDKKMKKGVAKKADSCSAEVNKPPSRKGTVNKVQSCSEVDKAIRKGSVKKPGSCPDVEKTLAKKELAKKADGYSVVQKAIKKAKKADSCSEIDKLTAKKGSVKETGSCSDVDKAKKVVAKKIHGNLEVDKAIKKGTVAKIDSNSVVENITEGPAKKVESCAEVNKTTKIVSSQRKTSGNYHKENEVKKPRKCWNLDGCHSISISPKHAPDQPKRGSFHRKSSNTSEDSVADMDEELRAMLYMRDQRVLKKHAMYDENGRKIQQGNPVVCPAPNTIDSNCANVKLKPNKRRSVNVVPSDVPREAKQKRRSCFPLSTTHEMPNSNSKILRGASENTKTTINVSTSKRTVPPIGRQVKTALGAANHNKVETTGINRPKSIRLACKKATANNADDEIEELIAQHNARLAAKPRRAKK